MERVIGVLEVGARSNSVDFADFTDIFVPTLNSLLLIGIDRTECKEGGGGCDDIGKSTVEADTSIIDGVAESAAYVCASILGLMFYTALRWV